MIGYVQAFSVLDAGRFLVGRGSLARPLTRRFQGRIAWIGLVLPREWDSPIRRYRGPKHLSAFGDVNPDAYPGFSLEFAEAMQGIQARRIAAFVDRFAKHAEPWAILVHCMRGVARSGAVAQWVFERYAPMPAEEYEALHTHTLPNPYVLRLLHEAR